LKVTVISDIHSNLDALKAVIASLPSYDSLLCLGDIVGYGPEPDGVIEELRRLQPKITLMGNHDYAVTTGDVSGFSHHAALAVEWTRGHISKENMQYLSLLPLTGRAEVNGKRVGLFHGSPDDPLIEYVFPDISQLGAAKLIQRANADIVLLGHTHIPMAYSVRNALLANPGSVGQPRDGDPRASFAIVTISDDRVMFDMRRIEYDVDSVANKIQGTGLPRFLADRLYAGV
jgi:putative phosphoesterase